MKWFCILYGLFLAGCAEKMYPTKFDVFPEMNGKVYYYDTIKVVGATKAALFTQARQWLNSMNLQKYNSFTPRENLSAIDAMHVGTIDSSAGKLSATLSSPVYFGYSTTNMIQGIYETWHVTYKVNIVVRDSGYLYIIDNFKGYYKYGAGLLPASSYRSYPGIDPVPISNTVKNSFVNQFKEEKVVAFFRRVDDRIRLVISSLEDAMSSK